MVGSISALLNSRHCHHFQVKPVPLVFAGKTKKRNLSQQKELPISRAERPADDIIVHRLGPDEKSGPKRLLEVFLVCGMCEKVAIKSRLMAFIRNLTRDEAVLWFQELHTSGGPLISNLQHKEQSSVFSVIETRAHENFEKTCLEQKLKGIVPFEEFSDGAWSTILTKDPTWEGCLKKELLLFIKEFSITDMPKPKNLSIEGTKTVVRTLKKTYSVKFFADLDVKYLNP